MKTIYAFSLLIGLVFTSCGQFNSTNTEHHRESEKRVLKELRSDLVQNLSDINANIESLELSENANRLIIDHMDKSIPYHDSLNYYFANLYPYLVFAPNETTFNYLKQAGMSIISNDSIRSAVSDLYGVNFGIYKSYESIYFVEHYANYIKPMIISEFRTFKFYRSFMPKNYSQFIKNQEYKIIMSYTADACQSFRFMQSNLKESVERLISTIDIEINE